MDGKIHFKECCKKLGLNCDELFQLGQSRAVVRDRLTYRRSYLTRKDTHLFVVCYFANEGVYIAWNLKEEKGRKKTTFSIKRSAAEIPFQGTVHSVAKSIEYSGWDEETVFVFEPDAVETFLMQCC